MLDKKARPRGLHPLGPAQEGVQAGSSDRRHPRGVGRRRRRLHHPGPHPARTGQGRPRLRQHHPGLLHRVPAPGARTHPGAARRVADPSSSRTTPSSSAWAAPSPTPAPTRTSCTTIPASPSRPTPSRQGDEYVINGTKHFISCGGVAKLYFLYVRTDKKGPISTQHERASWCPPTRRASPSAATTTSSAAGCSPTPSSSSRTAACRPRTSSAKRATPGVPRVKAGRPAEGLDQGPRAPRRRSACWAPPSTWAPSSPATKRRSTTAGSASRAASRSSSSSTWPSTWPA